MNKVFLPLHDRKATVVHYGDWLLKFAASVSWRVLTYCRLENGLSRFPARLLGRLDMAAMTWKEFLLENRPDLGHFEQHIVPLDEVEGIVGSGLPANINRYLLRSVDATVLWSPKWAYVYAKMCRILLIGFIHMPCPQLWRGTRIRARAGKLGGINVSSPSFLLDDIVERAKGVRRAERSLSPRQLAIIDRDYRKNLSKFTGSDMFRALDQDVRLFGRRTFHFDPDAED